MKNLLSLLSLALFLLLYSCGTGTGTANDPEASQVGEAAEETAPDFRRNYEGSIDGKYDIVMHLNSNQGQLSGDYRYKNQQKPLKITGELDGDGSLSLREFNDKGNQTGLFKGQLDGLGIAGTWSAPDGSKSMPFSVTEVKGGDAASDLGKSVAGKGNKKALLGGLVGEHPLQSIEAFMGANTMADFMLEDGKWTAGGSSIVNAMREPYDIDLTTDDLRKLKSAKIVVSPELSVSFSCGGKTFLSASYQEKGMTYQVKGDLKEYYNAGLPDDFSESSSFVDGKWYFLVRDEMGTELEAADIAQVGADAAVLKYDEGSKAFELTLFNSGCCDNAIYTFK